MNGASLGLFAGFLENFHAKARSLKARKVVVRKFSVLPGALLVPYFFYYNNFEFPLRLCAFAPLREFCESSYRVAS